MPPGDDGSEEEDPIQSDLDANNLDAVDPFVSDEQQRDDAGEEAAQALDLTALGKEHGFRNDVAKSDAGGG